MIRITERAAGVRIFQKPGVIKVGSSLSYHARRWYVPGASAFPLAQHYVAMLAWVS